MKSITNIIVSHVLFIALFAVAAVAFAQETNSGNRPSTSPAITAEERQAEMQERAAQMQENMEVRQGEQASTMEERRTALNERAQERLTNLSANMSNRMDAAIVRLTNIANRLESRIGKLHTQGIDTATAESTLASARLSIESAGDAITDIDVSVAEFVTAEDARTAWSDTRNEFTTARDHLKTAHTELRATIAALKSAVAAADLGQGVSDVVSQNTASSTNQDTEEGDEDIISE